MQLVKSLDFFLMCSLINPQTCTTAPDKAIDETNWLRNLFRKILLIEVAV